MAGDVIAKASLSVLSYVPHIDYTYLWWFRQNGLTYRLYGFSFSPLQGVLYRFHIIRPNARRCIITPGNRSAPLCAQPPPYCNTRIVMEPKPKKLPDEVRDALCLKHYSIHTENADVD
jgi:hypothetical protein